MPDVSLIIISWKMRDFVERLLTSFQKFSSGFTYELIFIDNRSCDGTVEMLEEKFPEAILIKNSENKGVAPARNQGLRIAKGKYILILDADMEIKENSIYQLFDFMEKTPDAGLVGCKLTFSDGTLQYTCKRFPKLSALLARRLEGIGFVKNSRTLNDHIMKEWDHNSIAEVDYVIGACQFFRREMINLIGYYDEKIFYGPEDLDFCLRIWKKNYKVFYYPFTSIVHHEQRITKKNLFSMISFKHLAGIFYIFKKYNYSIKR
ncbi:MAG: glycosyltransferase family 2 protein [Ignavibacteriales bacterium]|nr:MAG: glycosyltransferase family 2 protein [Ignavibacteriales bacterium]